MYKDIYYESERLCVLFERVDVCVYVFGCEGERAGCSSVPDAVFAPHTQFIILSNRLSTWFGHVQISPPISKEAFRNQREYEHSEELKNTCIHSNSNTHIYSHELMMYTPHSSENSSFSHSQLKSSIDTFLLSFISFLWHGKTNFLFRLSKKSYIVFTLYQIDLILLNFLMFRPFCNRAEESRTWEHA